MTDLVVRFSDALATDPAVTGGKGSVLAKLVKAKLPVPDGFVVTVAAFQQSLSELLPEIEESLASLTHEDTKEIERASEHAISLLGQHSMSSELTDAIEAGHEALGGGSVAVRSSATAEDMPEASFAGQYDTYLNVLTPKNVVQRVLDVWASLYSVHAIAYRKRQGISESALRMAVVVQRLLPAEAAGVLFTRDPVSGADDQFVINVAYGLGEGVVDGTVPVDQFSLHAETGDVLSEEIAEKQHMMALGDNGGLERIEVEAGRRSDPALSGQQLSELAGLARSVKELFGGHQDIEFAALDDTVYLLQARPVTAIEETPEFPVTWDDPADEQYGWVLGAIGQREAHPTSHLERDALEFYAEGSRVCLEKTGSMMARLHIHHYQNGYRYISAPEIDEDEVEEKLRRLRGRSERLVNSGKSWWEIDIKPGVERVLAGLEGMRPERASLPELVDHLDRSMKGFGVVLGDLHWRLAGSREDPMGWATMFTEATGQPTMEAGTIVQAVENKTTRMVRWLRELARVVQSDAKLRAIFEQHDYDRLKEPAVRDRPAVRRFRTRFRNLMRHYGRRNGRGFGSATNFMSPTWNIDPRVPLDLIASYAAQDIDALEQVEADARKERDAAVRRYRRELADEPERLDLFERALKHGRDYVTLMENHNHMMEQDTNGAMRDAVHWVGQRLVRDGLIDEPDDVVHLALDELKGIGVGSGPADVRALVLERKREYEGRSRLKPPPMIGKGPPPKMPGRARFMEGPGDEAGRDGSTIRGTAASRGRATGRAFVAPQTAKPPDIKKGDILVALNAGPNWTPILPLIAGLVLDQGAVFQHAALVAREYRVPAVIMTKEATSVIKDGQTITVDGDQGIVELQ